jgi:uncharacterized membrane protein YfcA
MSKEVLEMTVPPGRPGTRRTGRKLNQPLIKSVIVALSGTFTAIGSAVTGLGAHLAFGPMLTWMFGYGTDKAQGTALRFSIIAALTTVISYFVVVSSARHAGVGYATALQSAEIPLHLMRGEFLLIGSTLGAILAARFTPKATATGLLRALQSIGVVVAIFTVTEAMHLTAVTRSNTHYAQLSSWWQIILLGVGVGAVTQITRLAAGTLMVPALYFLTAVPNTVLGLRPLTPPEAVIESLIVVLLAALLPAWGYAQRKLIDGTYAFPAALGALVGGALGALLLNNLQERVILILFGIVAMFFAAREISRLANLPPADSDSAPVE